MDQTTDKSVLADFSGASFAYYGKEVRVRRGSGG
jgi:hypothetical protein